MSAVQAAQSIPGALDAADEERPPAARRRRSRSRAYAKLRDYLIRMDDDVTCKTCQKRFEIPSHQSMVFLDEQGKQASQGSPGNDDDDNRGNRA